MVTLSAEVLGDILVTVPGCPDMMAESALYRATQQFCMDTHAWRHTTYASPVIQGIREVPLVLPNGALPLRVFWATLAGDRLDGVSATRLTAAEGRPTAYAMSESGEMLLDRIPSRDWIEDGVIAHLSLIPRTRLATLGTAVTAFGDAVAQLAIAKLLAMPSVEWRDPRGAADAMAFYQARVLDARRFGQQHGQPIHRKVTYGGL